METGMIDTQESLQFAGMATRVIAGLSTAAPYTVMEMRVEPGGGAPLHRSLDEDKTFVVLEGALDFRFGENVREAGAGETIAVAPGDVHGFTNRSATSARVLLVASPARHDAFFRAMAALPVPHEPDAVRRVCAQFRQQIVGL
ncbi:Quercetin dioxygenase-like cupin family protein [Paraburkholderia tropica]|uniref:cupin domain-containing protein n=1 Tax=Paraburkholderia tropica TaxID=92647 RepID=UPI001CB3CCDC|nr:cupin domain-containing protein [Paraburkholderia tropica]CAG9216517.1 Quercetin dioxygenase-like cupin family protein [Paraburkholderia tropica]